jgi:hypothetical protein
LEVFIMHSQRWLGAAVVCAGAVALATSVGCGSNGSSNPSNGEDAGGGGAGSDSGAAHADAGTLYERLGGHAGIRSAVNAVVQAELGDPDLASYFFNQVAVPVPAGHPTVDQLSECFTDQLANAAGGPEAYPTTVTDDAGSWTCRDMASIHGPLHISGGTFSKFVTIAAGELGTLGVVSSDITTIGGVLTGAQPAIVDSNLADAGEMPYDAASP